MSVCYCEQCREVTDVEVLAVRVVSVKTEKQYTFHLGCLKTLESLGAQFKQLEYVTDNNIESFDDLPEECDICINLFSWC